MSWPKKAASSVPSSLKILDVCREYVVQPEFELRLTDFFLQVEDELPEHVTDKY